MGDLTPWALILSRGTAFAENGGHAYVYNENMWDSTIGKGCSKFSYNWSNGLKSNSYFAALLGEVQNYYIPQFTSTQIVGTLYDNSGGPTGHTITYPWNNNW